MKPMKILRLEIAQPATTIPDRPDVEVTRRQSRVTNPTVA